MIRRASDSIGVRRRALGSDGLTLIEMIIVLGLIGLMTAMGQAQYQKYLARSRQTEAKVALGGRFTTLKSFYAIQGTYSQCIFHFGPAAPVGITYYSLGFPLAIAGNCGPNANLSCSYYSYTAAGTGVAVCAAGPSTSSAYYSNRWANPNAAAAGTKRAKLAALDSMTRTTFTLPAVGSISPASDPAGGGGPAWDSWTIDQDKELRQVENGNL